MALLPAPRVSLLLGLALLIAVAQGSAPAPTVPAACRWRFSAFEGFAAYRQQALAACSVQAASTKLTCTNACKALLAQVRLQPAAAADRRRRQRDRRGAILAPGIYSTLPPPALLQINLACAKAVGAAYGQSVIAAFEQGYLACAAGRKVAA